VQNIGNYPLYSRESDTEPTEDDIGFIVPPQEFLRYENTGLELYLKGDTAIAIEEEE
jgi:hypothetical protein